MNLRLSIAMIVVGILAAPHSAVCQEVRLRPVTVLETSDNAITAQRQPANQGSSGSTSSSVAPMFRPFLGAIQNQLSAGMVMRLPSFNIDDVAGNKVNLFPVIEPYQRDKLQIRIASTPGCVSRSCLYGYIGTVAKNANDEHLDFLFSNLPEVRRTPINLGNGIRGVRVDVNMQGVSARPYKAIVWEQDNQFYIVSLYSKSFVEIAVSMAKGTPIRGKR